MLEWIAACIARWASALVDDLHALYLVEGWRSHGFDLEDDLHGRSCTAMTLRRADWLLALLCSSGETLRRFGAFSESDSRLGGAALSEHYAAKRAQAVAWQVTP